VIGSGTGIAGLLILLGLGAYGYWKRQWLKAKVIINIYYNIISYY